MSDEPLTFELGQFEYLPATAGTALVRVAGSWPSDDVAEPTLVVRTPFGDDRVEPLPDSAGRPVPGAPWRAAFSLALHVITGGTATFFLDAGAGTEIELPQPSERGEVGAFDRVAAGRELGELRAANERLSARVAELERQLAVAQEEMKPRQARTVAKAREEAERERIMRTALEQRLEAELERGGEERAGVADLRQERDRLRAELERLRAEGEAARRQAAEGAAVASEAGDERATAALEEVRAKLEGEVVDLKRRVLHAEREAADADKARDRPKRERPGRERPPRPRHPAPVANIPAEPVGPSLARRIEILRQEESVALEGVERLHAAGVGNDGPEVEAVDAAAELERLTAERQDLEQQLEAARVNVERAARSQLRRSSRGALRDTASRLAASLAEGEEVLHLAAGGQREARRLVAATDRRLLVFEGLDSEPEAVGYHEVESVQAARKGTLQVSTKRGQFRVEQVAGDLDGLVQHVNKQIWDVLHRAGDEAAASAPGDPECE